MSSVTRRNVLRAGVALSASGLLPASVRRAEALLAAYSDVPSAEASSAIAPRERLLLDFNWKFFQGNAADPRRDLGFGMGQGDFAKSGEFEFATAKFDDSKWRSLNLPHDWAVELPFVRDEEQQSPWLQAAGPALSGDQHRLVPAHVRFPAKKTQGGASAWNSMEPFAARSCFVNGYFIGRNDNGYAPFCFDLTDFANFGGKNFLVVRMDASFGDGWFYEGAGIYRHVWLTKTDPLHLGTMGKLRTADRERQCRSD